MRVANVSHKLIGKKLGKNVYNNTGRLLLGQEVILTASLIDKLIEQDIFIVQVEDKISKGIVVDDIVPEEQMIHSIRTVKHVLEKAASCSMSVSSMINEDDVDAVGDVIKALIEELENSKDTLYTVVDLVGADMYTYKHSVNVAILSILTCRSLGYDYELTKNIAMGALLHDIGKACVKDNLIQKPGLLTEEELVEVKKHVEYGYDLIKDEITLSGFTKQIVRLHHEKRDGSGYPLGLKEVEIPDFIRIVTICDMFDAMTSTRVYRGSMPVYEVLDILMADSIYRLDAAILQHFIKNICIFPPGTGIQLMDGRYGLVVAYNTFSPTRPKIRLFEDENQVKMVHHINLEDHRTLFIERSVPSDIVYEHYKLS